MYYCINTGTTLRLLYMLCVLYNMMDYVMNVINVLLLHT